MMLVEGAFMGFRSIATAGVYLDLSRWHKGSLGDRCFPADDKVT
jgi:hypothetical protein